MSKRDKGFENMDLRQGYPNLLGPYNGKLKRPMDVGVRVSEVCPCSVWDKKVLFCPVVPCVGRSDKVCIHCTKYCWFLITLL
jgi:hypothetical protein